MNFKQMMGLGMISAMALGSMSIAAQAGSFTFYKQMDATHTKACTLSDEGIQRHNLKAPMNKPCTNDDLRSVVLEDVKPGTVLRLYDNQWGHKTDSWAEITVKQSHPRYVMHSFEGNFEDEWVKAEYHGDFQLKNKKNDAKYRVESNQGLNGYVSRIEINETITNF